MVRPHSLSFAGEPSASTRVPYMVAPPRAVHLPQMYDLYQECINAMELVPSRLRGEGADWGERLPPSGAPAQAGATPRMKFRALIETGGGLAIEAAL